MHKELIKEPLVKERNIASTVGNNNTIEEGGVMNLQVTTAQTLIQNIYEGVTQTLKEPTEAEIIENMKACYKNKGCNEKLIKLNHLFDPEDTRKTFTSAVLLNEESVGKTNLCQHIAYRWATEGLWAEKFDLLIWIPLRHLINSADYPDKKATLTEAVFKECFLDDTNGEKPFTREGFENVFKKMNLTKNVLYLLEGYEEVALIEQQTVKTPQGNLIRTLLSQKNIILTSRLDALKYNPFYHLENKRPIWIETHEGFLNLIENAEAALPAYLFSQNAGDKTLLNSIPYEIRHYLQALSTSEIFQEDLDLYIPINGSHTPYSTSTFDLYENLKRFLASPKEVLLLLGESGGGKSLFGQALIQKLVQNHQADDPTPFFISLPTLRQSKNGLMEEILLQHGFSKASIPELKKSHRFFLILDAYDEMGETNNFNLYQLNKMDEWQIKVMVTCRTSYLTQLTNYKSYFVPFKAGNPRYDIFDEHYIVPFSEVQIGSYIHQYLTIKQEELQNEIQSRPELSLEWLKAETYLMWINQIPGLSALVHTPFLLKITLQVLPSIVAEYQKTQNQDERFNMTGVKLYDAFMAYWFARQEEKLIGLGTHPGRSLYKDYMTFTKALAKKMHENHLSQVVYTQESNLFGEKTTFSEWDMFFSDDFIPSDKKDEKRRDARMIARKGCPLRKVAVDQYAFIHASILDYFISLVIFDPSLMKAHCQPSEPPKQRMGVIEAAKLRPEKVSENPPIPVLGEMGVGGTEVEKKVPTADVNLVHHNDSVQILPAQLLSSQGVFKASRLTLDDRKIFRAAEALIQQVSPNKYQEDTDIRVLSQELKGIVASHREKNEKLAKDDIDDINNRVEEIQELKNAMDGGNENVSCNK